MYIDSHCCLQCSASSTFNGDLYKDQLQEVQDIRGSRSAFAALLADRRVVTWGDAFNGGDSSEVMHLLEAAGICGCGEDG